MLTRKSGDKGGSVKFMLNSKTKKVNSATYFHLTGSSKWYFQWLSKGN